MLKVLNVFVAVIATLVISNSAFAAAASSGGGDTAGVAANGNTNFRFSPIVLIVGAFDVNLDFKVSPNWTLGPQIGYWNFKVKERGAFDDDFKVKAFTIGARANWFKNGVYTDGLYVGPSLGYASAKVESKDSFGDNVSAEGKTLYASCLVGYGWFWQSFNMMLGGGLTLPLGDREVEVKDSTGTSTEDINTVSSLALEFSLGWTF